MHQPQGEAQSKPRTIEELVPSQLSSYRAARNGKLVRRARDAEADRLGVSVDEWRLLFVLSRLGPLPSIRIAEHAIMDRGTVSRAVARMEERGLLFRISDATDRRKSIVNLTEKGAGIANQISSFMLNRELEMIADLTDEEWRVWLAVTDKIYARLKAMYEDD